MSNIYRVEVKLKKCSEWGQFNSLRECLDWVYHSELNWDPQEIIEFTIAENGLTVLAYEWEYDLEAGSRYLVWRKRV